MAKNATATKQNPELEEACERIAARLGLEWSEIELNNPRRHDVLSAAERELAEAQAKAEAEAAASEAASSGTSDPQS
jgi:hypothetical protein